MQPAFARKIAAEIEGVVASLETDEIVVAERWNEPLVMRKGGEDFGRRAWNVQEEADAVLVAKIAQRFGQRHQVIVVDPDQVVRPEHVVQLAGKVVVAPQITREGRAGRIRRLDS